MIFRCLVLFVLSTLFACSEPATSNTEVPVSTTVPEVKKDSVIIPPVPKPVYDYDTTQWTELTRIDSSIVLDMRYATTNNFVEEVLYDCGRCFLRPEAARAVASANKKLKTKGYRLKMFDCFRPIPVQQKLWDKFQNPSYVTPPSKGSMHNRGLAVDITIVDESGEELDMGTEFDYFGQEAHHTYTGHSEEIQRNRILLKSTLEGLGFKGIRTEWWHYSFLGTKHRLSEMVWECPE